ncbi:MAG: AEC family transporter [bacterium]
MIQSILTILSLLGVGYIARILGLFKPQDAQFLNRLVLYIFMPATVFYGVYNLKLEVTLLRLPLVAITSILVLLPFLVLVTRRMSGPLRGAFILTGLFGNTGFLGYPVSLLSYGNEGLARAILYDQLGFTVALTTIGVWIAKRYGRGGARFSFKETLFGIITYPPFPALILAFALKHVHLPEFFLKALSYLSNATVPVIMIGIGGLLQLQMNKRYFGILGGTIALKLFIFPVVNLFLALIFHLDLLSLEVVIIESGVPVMISSVVFGTEYGLDIEFILSAILITTLLVIITLPGINALLLKLVLTGY